MKFDKLVVAGCSVSDRGNVDFCYGDKLSELLGCEYDHQGAGCGSNDRIWRVVTRKVIDGEITPSTLLIVQYTEPTRKEFWSSNISLHYHDMYYDPAEVAGRVQLREPFDDGELIRYKLGSETWQPNKKDKNFFHIYENEFLNGAYSYEIFKTSHFNFMHMLVSRNINVIFVKAWGYAPINDLWFPDTIKIINLDDAMISNEHKYDAAHLNNSGHEYFSNILYDFISKNF